MNLIGSFENRVAVLGLDTRVREVQIVVVDRQSLVVLQYLEVELLVDALELDVLV